MDEEPRLPEQASHNLRSAILDGASSSLFVQRSDSSRPDWDKEIYFIYRGEVDSLFLPFRDESRIEANAPQSKVLFSIFEGL
jgi:hypothetical protein